MTNSISIAIDTLKQFKSELDKADRKRKKENNLNKKLTTTIAFANQVHAIESTINGGALEKAFGLAAVNKPYHESPLYNTLPMIGLRLCKAKRLGFKHYIMVDLMVAGGAFLAVKPLD